MGKFLEVTNRKLAERDASNKTEEEQIAKKWEKGELEVLSYKQREAIIKQMKEKQDISEFAKAMVLSMEKENKKIDKQINIGTLRLDNYKTNVELFLANNPFCYDKTGLFWFWIGTEHKWKQIDEIDLMNNIDNALGFAGHTISASVRGNYMEAFKRVGRMNIPADAPKHWVQLHDTIIDIENDRYIPAKPEYFITNPIPWEMGETDETPIMDAIFEQWVGKDYVLLLYEIIAYCMLPDYPIHRIFCCVGSGLNGKSKFMEVIRRFIGHDNCCSTELDLLLQSRFERTKLHKKLMCQMGETNFDEIGKTSILKMLTGQDIIGYEYKNKNPFNGYNYAKILISTNSLPPTTDMTDGFYRRWIIIDFANKFNEDQDILSTIPEQEYNNLANKCVKILLKLWKERKFTKEGTIQERMQRYEDKSNPLKKFILEMTEQDVNGHIFKYEFKREFDDYCKQRNLRLWTDAAVGKHMKANDYEIGRITAEWFTQEGEKPRYLAWLGLKLKENVRLVRVVTPFSLLSPIGEKSENSMPKSDKSDTNQVPHEIKVLEEQI